MAQSTSSGTRKRASTGARKKPAAAAATKRTSSGTRKRTASASASRTRAQSANGRGKPGAVPEAMHKVTGAVGDATGAVTGALGSTAKKVRGPALAGGAAAAAAAGGLLLGRQLAPKRRKVLGVQLPKPKSLPKPHLDGLVPSRKAVDLKPIAKRISEGGKQLSKLSGEVDRVAKTAQKVGDSLS